MKRRVAVTTPEVRIVATINTRGWLLTRDEVNRIGEQLADRLQEAASDLIYFKTARHKVRVW